MKALLLSATLMLAVSASPALADDLFGQNPYECVFAAKASHADNTTRRSDLADCLMKVSDVGQARRTLDTTHFEVDGQLRREVESKFASGQVGWARAMLGDLITQRPQDPARVEQLRNDVVMQQQQYRISLCLSHPERTSPSRDQACRGVEGFHNSTGRVNPENADTQRARGEHVSK